MNQPQGIGTTGAAANYQDSPYYRDAQALHSWMFSRACTHPNRVSAQDVQIATGRLDRVVELLKARASQEDTAAAKRFNGRIRDVLGKMAQAKERANR